MENIDRKAITKAVEARLGRKLRSYESLGHPDVLDALIYAINPDGSPPPTLLYPGFKVEGFNPKGWETDSLE